MPNRKDYSKAMGVLCSLALILVYCVTALATQQVHEEAKALPPDEGEEPGRPRLETKAVVVTGAIVTNGSDFALLDDTGKLYRLAALDRAERLVGKSVKVRGKLEVSANLLHVEAVDPIAA